MQTGPGYLDHRIALVSGGVPLGGSTTFLINFAGELVRRGVPVEVLSLEGTNPMAEDFQQQQIPLLCLDDRRLIFEDRLEMTLRRLALFRPTVVVSTLGGSFNILKYLPGGIFRIGMAQSDDPHVYGGMHWCLPYLDLVVVVAKAMMPRMEAFTAISGTKVACLPYGVPMNASAGNRVHDPSMPLRILYLGRLAHEQKRVRLFPEILRDLQASGIPFHWTIAGEGEDRAFLEANLKSPSSQQTVSFAGPVRYTDVPALLDRHDVFLLTSDYEGLPLSLLEAMGRGLVPVVSALESGIPEVVDDANGCLVPVADVAEYARGIVDLHRNRDLLAAKSAAARRRVEETFSVSAMTDRWLAALPEKPAVPEAWPDSWKLEAPLGAPHPFFFSPRWRPLRRLVKSLN